MPATSKVWVGLKIHLLLAVYLMSASCSDSEVAVCNDKDELALKIENPLSPWGHTVINAQAQTLGAYKEWVYFKDSASASYEKCLPGICPQWHPKLDDCFYVFLGVGYDSKSELWLADAKRRQFMNKVTEGKFYINSTPVISPNGKRLASVFRPLAKADGDTWKVSVIFLAATSSQESRQEWVFEINEGYMSDIAFSDDETLSITHTKGEVTQREKISLAGPFHLTR